MKRTLIDARQLLIPVKQPERWFGVTDLMNIYRGCEHGCIYCDSRSECYQIEDFDGELVVKQNAPTLLQNELARKRKVGVIGTGSMSDPYTLAENDLLLTRKCLEIVARHGFPLHITTKSDLILRDIDYLQKIQKTGLSIAITLTTLNDELAKVIEPHAPSPSKRLKTIKTLSQAGITVGVAMMPILPFIEDELQDLLMIVCETKKNGGEFILPYLGVTLRDRQRSYFYRELDKHFPKVKTMYQKNYLDNYFCQCQNVREISQRFAETCKELGIQTKMKNYAVKTQVEQLKWI